MTNIEAMKLALDALEGGLWDYGPGQDEHDKCNEIIAALRQAISEAKQAEQEPIYISQACAERGCACHYSVEVDGEPVAVYTAPPQREWVSLTDADLLIIRDEYNLSWDVLDFARAIETKLKEKNS